MTGESKVVNGSVGWRRKDNKAACCALLRHCPKCKLKVKTKVEIQENQGVKSQESRVEKPAMPAMVDPPNVVSVGLQKLFPRFAFALFFSTLSIRQCKAVPVRPAFCQATSSLQLLKLAIPRSEDEAFAGFHKSWPTILLTVTRAVSEEPDIP